MPLKNSGGSMKFLGGLKVIHRTAQTALELSTPRQVCFLLIRRKSVLHVQFVFLLIRSISLEAIFVVVPRLVLHDLIFFVYTYY